MILKTKAFFLFNTIIFNKVGKSAIKNEQLKCTSIQ